MRILLTLFFLALCACTHGTQISEREPSTENLATWVGPMPFQDGSKAKVEPAYEWVRGALIRPDFRKLFTAPNEWQNVLKQTRVFKLYIGTLYPQDGKPKYMDFGVSDSELRQMAEFFNKNKIQVAIELGGIRPPFDNCQDLVEKTFQEERRHLERWLSVGGRLDYLVFDHPIGFSLMAQKWNRTTGEALPQANSCQNSFDFIASEAVRALFKYQNYFKTKMPALKVGLIESLGYYTFLSSTAKDKIFKYTTTAPDRYPEFLFSRLLDLIQKESVRMNFEVDHFGLDFNDAYFFEADRYRKQSRFISKNGNLPPRDYGRLFSAIDELRKRKMKIAYIINAFGKTPTEAELYSKTFRTDITRAKGPFDYEVFQFWHHIPPTTLPETQAGTAMNIFLNIMNTKIETPK